MQKVFITIALTFTFNATFSQAKYPFKRYYDLVNNAADASDSLKNIEALTCYEKAFKSVKYPLLRDLKRAALTNVRLENKNKALAFYSQAAEHGFIPPDSILKKIDSLNFQTLLASLESKKQASYQRFNKKYLKIIDSLYNVDQNIRHSNKFFLNGLNIDSLNTHCLLRAIKQYGFPSTKNVGTEHSSKAFLIFLHADFDINNSLLGKQLLTAVQNGQFLPANYAEIIDRRCNFGGRPFVYYQVPFGYDELSIIEKGKVEKARALIGLRSVEKTIEYKFTPDGTLQVKNKE